MLEMSDIDPFDSPEAKPYMNNKEIVSMTNLRQAYTGKDVQRFEQILRDNSSAILGDTFIREHVEELVNRFRSQVLLELIAPYKRIEIAFAARELNIESRELEELLISLIIDGKVDGQIDQLNNRLILRDAQDGVAKYNAMQNWSNELYRLRMSMSNLLL